MTDLDELPFSSPTTAPNAGAAPRRRCLHPRQYRRPLEDGGTACTRCGSDISLAASLRGRRSRNRGNAIERDIARKLGLRRTGQYGGPDDASGEMFVAQVKSGGRFPELYWRWLRAMTVNAGQTPLLVVTDAPGPGHRRRAVVVVDLEDWAALHGATGEVA